MPQNRSNQKIVVFFLGFFFLVAIFLSIGFGYYLIVPAKKEAREQVFNVREGLTLKEVAGELERKGLITNKSPFLLWARLMGYSKKIKAGEYRLNSGMTPVKILHMLCKGAIITYPVTIPEGFTRKQIGALMEKKGLVNRDEFLSITGDPKTAKRYGLSGNDLEGYLYPDTYRFSRGLPAVTVIDVMVRRFWEVIEPMLGMADGADMTIEEVVTLASIVEKETGRAEERPIIASVFLNRLKKRMRLESDPTVIYGIENFNGNLTRKDLAQRTPYNTYVIRELPLGPIGNPGFESIKAVLLPARTDYLYFVSKNDGTHYFSKTLKEHNRAVNIYQKKRRKRRKK